MNKISRWFIVCILILFGVSLLNKGLDLRSLGANVDGDGIGVYFLGFEINDRVPEESISSYAIGFFISSFLALFASLAFIGINLISRKKES
jgi:ABC-type Na+ efflux pump permease subunit